MGAFTMLVTAQLLHTWTCRARGREASPQLGRAVIGGFVLQFGTLASRFAREALGVGTTSALSSVGAAPSLRRARGLRRPEEIVVEAEQARAAA